MPTVGDDGFPIKFLSILTERNDCLPAITAFLNAKAISKGFLLWQLQY